MSNHPWYIGLDLGKMSDHTALCVMEELEFPDKKPREYHIRHLERFPLKTSYHSVADRVTEIMNSGKFPDAPSLVVDATGVGAPVVELLQNRGLYVNEVTITGGDSVSQEGGGKYRVPKRDLVSAVQILLQAGRLKISKALPLAELLLKEMNSFQVKISLSTGHDSYGAAWREGAHDDMVLSVALACWYAEQCQMRFDFLEYARLLREYDEKMGCGERLWRSG